MKVQGRVLIIDDDEDYRIVVKKILEGAGFSCQEAINIQEAKEQLSQNPPHLVYLDMNLEGESGLDFLEEMKSSKSLEDIPIVVVSNINNKKVIDKAVYLGAQDYILKPINSGHMITKTKAIITKQELRSKEISSLSQLSLYATIECEVVKISETIVCIESGCRLTPGTELEIDSDFMQEIGISVKRVNSLGKGILQSNGQYHSYLQFKGADEKALTKIRRL